MNRYNQRQCSRIKNRYYCFREEVRDETPDLLHAARPVLRALAVLGLRSGSCRKWRSNICYGYSYSFQIVCNVVSRTFDEH
jgi:hypothetical protein